MAHVKCIEKCEKCIAICESVKNVLECMLFLFICVLSKTLYIKLVWFESVPKNLKFLLFRTENRIGLYKRVTDEGGQNSGTRKVPMPILTPYLKVVF